MAPPDPAAARPDRRSDWPLDDPEQDLLGVSRHAEALARLIIAAPAPFTIGVYGEWGAGKTTFVQFVKHYLDRVAGAGSPPIFIHFEAWRYTTADELWRALVLDIARAVYEIDPDASPCAPPSPAPAASRSLLDVLTSDAVVFRSATAEETKVDRFCRLVARLDATMYGGIGKRAQDERRLDQDETVLAAVNASLAALGAMSPLVGAVRRLFRLGDSVDAAKLFQREKSESTRERIESKREFQVVLAELLRAPPAPPAPPRLCVFLDDLDRCMPDVVLDLLEAIKIFLYVPRLIFVVAADEELIGQGLRLRYRELLDGENSAFEHDVLARKGREYFEKIIQLRINLPECTPERAHRFIAAQYPEWMPATDIILAAVGANPRRVKQYCSWLAYRRMVDQEEGEPA